MVTDSNFLASIQSEDSKHVWYFQSILEHELFSFVTHLFLCEFVVIGTTLKSGIVYDAQCCKICSDFKSIVVYSSLNISTYGTQFCRSVQSILVFIR